MPHEKQKFYTIQLLQGFCFSDNTVYHRVHPWACQVSHYIKRPPGNAICHVTHWHLKSQHVEKHQQFFFAPALYQNTRAFANPSASSIMVSLPDFPRSNVAQHHDAGVPVPTPKGFRQWHGNPMHHPKLPFPPVELICSLKISCHSRKPPGPTLRIGNSSSGLFLSTQLSYMVSKKEPHPNKLLLFVSDI